MFECTQRPASLHLVTLSHPSVLNLSYVKELLILGLLENPLECVVWCLIAVMCGLTGCAYKTVVDTSLCLQERKLLPSPRSAALWWRGEPPQISCKVYSPKPRLCITASAVGQYNHWAFFKAL